jgi:hypothetical protein
VNSGPYHLSNFSDFLVHVGFPSAFSDQKKNNHDIFYNHTEDV